MHWLALKARILEAGGARVSGEPVDAYLGVSAAGPSAGGKGSLFFGIGGHRVRIPVNPAGVLEVRHRGNGAADLVFPDEVVTGTLLMVGFHCPRQAYITVSEGCIFSCRYCRVPSGPVHRKSREEIVSMVASVRDRIDAISLTSGVLTSVEEEARYVLGVVFDLIPFGLPVGVSIYPAQDTPQRCHELGVTEVKWNLEAAAPAIFERMCPDLDREAVLSALKESVPLFGRDRVFSNVIIGLGESDRELEDCIADLTRMGVIPVLRPLSPNEGVPGLARPTAERLLKINRYLKEALYKAGLDPSRALTMCTACTGCDLVPGRDT